MEHTHMKCCLYYHKQNIVIIYIENLMSATCWILSIDRTNLFLNHSQVLGDKF